ncbi:efflux RND transporter periplasmic adaptor subunit [Methylomonas sp. CM2]|uniref:efflux RND transporter periplasmic adaptor subunit n=1 Tax=Methylomonas sp. CM2 TaxID=3417647 RepID=UPI003CFA959F
MRNLRIPACLLAASVAASAAAATDPDDAEPGQVPAAGATTEALTLTRSGQRLAGIVTRRLESSRRRSEFSAYGSVLNPEPLLAIRQQYLAAQVQQDSARAKFDESAHNLARTRDLHRQDIVSTRRLQEQQALWQADKSGLASSGYQQQAIAAASRLTWGATLTDWFTRPNHPQAEQLLTGQAQLLQITLPADAPVDLAVGKARIQADAQRQTELSAEAIAPAPQVDPVSQGRRYFMLCRACRLPYGAPLTAWLPGAETGQTGVRIPASALVWHLGQATVFVKSADDRFSARPLLDYAADGLDYFVTAGLQAGEEVVTTGAQTLLSQQLKGTASGEGDD